MRVVKAKSFIFVVAVVDVVVLKEIRRDQIRIANFFVERSDSGRGAMDGDKSFSIHLSFALSLRPIFFSQGHTWIQTFDVKTLRRAISPRKISRVLPTYSLRVLLCPPIICHIVALDAMDGVVVHFEGVWLAWFWFTKPVVCRDDAIMDEKLKKLKVYWWWWRFEWRQGPVKQDLHHLREPFRPTCEQKMKEKTYKSCVDVK